ncbi:hypothetical protein FD754_025187, partial [Muntiacus muntjak]
MSGGLISIPPKGYFPGRNFIRTLPERLYNGLLYFWPDAESKICYHQFMNALLLFAHFDHKGAPWVPFYQGHRTSSIGNFASLNQSFGLSVEEFGFDGMPFDGVLGLAFPSISLTGARPIFDNLWSQGAFLEPVFAFYLSKSKPEGSVVMFGGVDHRYYKGELNWVPVSHTRPWQISMNCTTMNGEVVACSRGCHATLNTGTSVIYGPKEMVTNIHKVMNAKVTPS